MKIFDQNNLTNVLIELGNRDCWCRRMRNTSHRPQVREVQQTLLLMNWRINGLEIWSR